MSHQKEKKKEINIYSPSNAIAIAMKKIESNL
jgi:hypothetical protein